MIHRPKSITAVSWTLIILGGLSLISSAISLNNPIAREMMAKSPIPVNVQFVMMFVGILIMIVCGAAMLKRQNWARLLYIGWSIAGFAVGLATSPVKAAMIPGIIIFLIIVFFLFRPKANEYFKATKTV